jgi:aryl-alcohol dehydrogenase-like predicted oxidoreductase
MEPSAMWVRRLGNSDLKLTPVGLGTWAIGGPGWADAWGPQDDRESIAAIHRALEMGINWIDTAPVYGLGHAEEVVGRAIAGRRDHVILATKCGLVWPEGGVEITRRLKAWSIRQEIEASLRRLNVEAIDLYQIHRAEPDEELEEGWDAIGDLIREGKVRYAGLSNIAVTQLARVHALRPTTSVQLLYNMLARSAEAQMLPYCSAHNIGVVGYSPLHSGLLSGAFSRERAAGLPDGDWRRRAREFQDPELRITLDILEELRRFAARRRTTLARVAIAWVLRRPEVTAVIVGARAPAQIEDTAGASEFTLSDGDVVEIDAALGRRATRLGEV